jgi:catechol 2,3-dioxygenase-like lactoylglutathione lyase family enzyme
MFSHVSSVSVFVSDQERAKKFYTETLGFELRTDAPLYPGASSRWIAVAPKGAQTDVILYLPDENWEHYRQVVGKSQSITIEVRDIMTLIDDLKAKGVRFMGEPNVQPWGTHAFMYDSEDNLLLLVEPPKRG